MSIGSWDPKHTAPGKYRIDAASLARFVALSHDDQLEVLTHTLSDDEKQRHAAIMKQPAEDWRHVAQSLSDDEIVHLIRFFTLAEHLPGWEAGDTSPVIYLNRALKSRGSQLPREILFWIKANSSNRFLPNGPLI